MTNLTLTLQIKQLEGVAPANLIGVKICNARTREVVGEIVAVMPLDGAVQATVRLHEGLDDAEPLQVYADLLPPREFEDLA